MAAAEQLVNGRRRKASARTTVILAWSVNELTADDRRRLLPTLIELSTCNARVLVIEPLDDMPEGTLGFRATGEIEREEYDQVLTPALRQAIDAGGGLRTLYLI